MPHAARAPNDPRDELRRMVDELPEEDLPRAKDLLARLRVEQALARAPEDDEPWTAEDEAALRASEEAHARGEVLSHEEAMRELGPD